MIVHQESQKRDIEYVILKYRRLWEIYTFALIHAVHVYHLKLHLGPMKVILLVSEWIRSLTITVSKNVFLEKWGLGLKLLEILDMSCTSYIMS